MDSSCCSGEGEERGRMRAFRSFVVEGPASGYSGSSRYNSGVLVAVGDPDESLAKEDMVSGAML